MKSVEKEAGLKLRYVSCLCVGQCHSSAFAEHPNIKGGGAAQASYPAIGAARKSMLEALTEVHLRRLDTADMLHRWGLPRSLLPGILLWLCRALLGTCCHRGASHILANNTGLQAVPEGRGRGHSHHLLVSREMQQRRLNMHARQRGMIMPAEAGSWHAFAAVSTCACSSSAQLCHLFWRRRAVASISIEASPEQVWEVLTDYEALPQFVPNLALCERLPVPPELRSRLVRLRQVRGCPCQGAGSAGLQQRRPRSLAAALQM